MRFHTVIIAFSLFLAACSSAPKKASDPSSFKQFDIEGKVVSVDRAKKKAEVDHKAIPGYMEAMTMSFPIRADWVWEDLKPGVDIKATLVVDPSDEKEGYWLENIAIVALPTADQPATPVGPEADIVGKQVADFTLTNQDGKKIGPKDFIGKTWAVTFIYAKCPLPNFCIKMSTNFSDAAKLIGAMSDKNSYALLSISFDPARDTPAKLKEYGIGYFGKDVKPDFATWQLAVGADADIRKIADFAGLKYGVDANDKALINHSLRTLIISPEGKVVKVIPGNDWSGADLVEMMKTGNR